MPTTTVEAALSTTELLEAILLFSDQMTLLTQRMRKRWLGVITASRKLQQAMSFYPVIHPAKPLVAYARAPEENADKPSISNLRKIKESLIWFW